MTPYLVYSTTPTLVVAEQLAEHLICTQLAACVNILPSMRSIYRWKGKIERADEVVMLAKTFEDKVEALIKYIVSHHPYECPAILSWPIQGGHPAFLEWMAAEVGLK